jgi:hypothetical protein
MATPDRAAALVGSTPMCLWTLKPRLKGQFLRPVTERVRTYLKILLAGAELAFSAPRPSGYFGDRGGTHDSQRARFTALTA